jgi:ribosomal protein S18 acetylase RimI-like enzyme
MSPELRDQVRALEVDAPQVEYAGTVECAIEGLGDVPDENIVGLGIFSGEDVAGFLVLKRRTKAPQWASPGMAVVSAMRIDRRLQGRGIGSGALSMVADWVRAHWPDCPVLALSVDEANVRGIAAYARAGFQDMGLRREGRIGWVRFMRLALSPG